MVKIADRGYSAEEILKLTAGEPRNIVKEFKNGEVLVKVAVLVRHPTTKDWTPFDWNIRCQKNAL